MTIRAIPGYIRNLFNTIAVNDHLGLQELNARLQLLGWDDFERDDSTIQLLVATLEINGLSSLEHCNPSFFSSSFNPEKNSTIHNYKIRPMELSYESKMQSSSQERR